MSFLTDLALAHQKHEGWFPGSLSQRNNNPGNLRLTPFQRTAFGAVPGDGGFARFPSYAVGLQALTDDLKAKITGHSAHINYAKNPTFLDYVRVYAPSDDGNDPKGYCQSLIHQLPQYHLAPDTPLSVLAGLIVNPQPLSLRLKIAEEAFNRVRGLRKFALTNAIDRLRKMLGGVN